MRSDLACEQNPVLLEEIEENLAVNRLRVDERLSSKIGKPVGYYVTVESKIVTDFLQEKYDRLSGVLSREIKNLLPDRVDKILVVGLGNRSLTADALGVLTLEKISAPKAIESGRLCLLSPGVFGVTGIESYDVIKGVVEVIKPSAIIAVDSLCAGKTSRIGTSFQISNAGIVPGSGVKNSRKELSKSTLGVEVISLGVPMVVFASTILSDAGCNCDLPVDLEDTVVTLKDVDIVVDGCATVVAKALEKIF